MQRSIRRFQVIPPIISVRLRRADEWFAGMLTTTGRMRVLPLIAPVLTKEMMAMPTISLAMMSLMQTLVPQSGNDSPAMSAPPRCVDETSGGSLVEAVAGGAAGGKVVQSFSSHSLGSREKTVFGPATPSHAKAHDYFAETPGGDGEQGLAGGAARSKVAIGVVATGACMRISRHDKGARRDHQLHRRRAEQQGGDGLQCIG